MDILILLLVMCLNLRIAMSNNFGSVKGNEDAFTSDAKEDSSLEENVTFNMKQTKQDGNELSNIIVQREPLMFESVMFENASVIYEPNIISNSMEISDVELSYSSDVPTNELNAEGTEYHTSLNSSFRFSEDSNQPTITVSQSSIEQVSTSQEGILWKLQRNFTYHDINDAIGEMVYKFISHHFVDFECVGIITEGNTDILDHIPETMFRYHVNIGKGSPVSNIEESDNLDYTKLNEETQMFESLLMDSLNAGCPFYIVQVLDPKAVIHCFARASRRADFRLNRKYLFLPTIKSNVFSVTEDIFTMKEMNYMPDLIISNIVLGQPMLKEEKLHNDSNLNVALKNCYIPPCYMSLEIELYTHKFVGKERSKIILIYTWMPGEDFPDEVNLFPDKTRDVEGRELVIITWDYPPFIVLNFNAKPPLFDGIEFRVAREFVQFVNATFRVSMDPNNYWGDVFDNGTGNGVLGFMAMDRGDIGFSAFYAWPSSFKVVDFSNTHMRSSVTMVTPRPKLKPGYLMPIMPFSGTMWVALGACYVGSVYTIYSLQLLVDKLLGSPTDARGHFSNLGYSALWLYAMLVSQTPDYILDSRIPTQVPARHFIAWFLVMGEVICDTYSAGLAYVLSTPRYEPPIETIEDLSHRHVIWAGNHVAWIWSIEEDTNPDLQAITRNFRVMTEERMNETGRKSGEIAFGIERLQGGHFTTESHINEGTVVLRRIMKGTLYWSHLYFLLRKGSPYKKHFNTLVTRLREAGLPLYWEGEVIRRYMSERLQLAISSSRILHDDDDVAKLSLNQLQGVFFLLILGQIVGTIAFIAELAASYKASKQKTIIEKFTKKRHSLKFSFEDLD